MAVPSRTALGMDLHTACCKRINFPALQKTLPLAVAAVVAGCVALVHMSSQRRVSSPDLSSGSAFARQCVFATMRVFTRPVFRKAPTRRRVSGSAFARPHVFATTRVLARPVFRKCLRAHVSARRRVFSPDLPSGSVFACPHVLGRRVSWPDLSSGSAFAAFGRRRLFLTTPAFATGTHMASFRDVSLPEQCAQEVPSDSHMFTLQDVSLPEMCLQTPTCRRCLRVAPVC